MKHLILPMKITLIIMGVLVVIIPFANLLPYKIGEITESIWRGLITGFLVAIIIDRFEK